MALLMNLRLRTKLFASFGVVCALMLLLAALFFHKLDRAETANARTVHTHELLDALDAVLLGMVNQETALRGFLLSGEERFLDTYRRGVGLVDTNLALLEEWTAEDARARALVEDVRTAALDWRRDHAERAMALRRDPATAQAATALETSGAGKAQMDAIRRMIADFSAAEGDLLAQRARELTAALDSGRLMAVGGVAIALVLALLCGFFLYASTSRPMLAATNALERLGEGQTEVVIPRTSRTDEIGRLVTAAHNLRGFVRRSIAQAQMIEEMPTAVMVADPEDDFRIAYVNRASRALFERLEAATGIRAAEIEGSSIDIFHTDPARQRQLLSDPSNLPHTTTITIGPEKVLLRVTAIRNAAGRYVSPMLTWHVITEKERMASNFETNVKQSVDRLTVAFDDVREKMRAVVAEARATEAESSSVAAAMEEANQSVQTVAAAAEELAGSIREVGDQVTRSAERSRTALGMGGDAAAKARSLSESADEIGDVVSLISDIAGQTNLLALNATIEAARAGEAGSGFAVVAREVKNLAEQTAKATEEIGAKIAQMRQATTTTVEAVATVQRLIEEVSGIFASVASAVEEQTAATAEISTAAQQAAESTQAVSESIAIVRRSSAHTGSSAETVLQKTAELTDAAAGLGQAANDFLGRVRAA